MWKLGDTLIRLNERFFFLNPYEGTFVRYKKKEDHPFKPL